MSKKTKTKFNDNEINRIQRAFGYTKEDISHFIEPIIKSGMEPIGSMGTDTPISAIIIISQTFLATLSNVFAQVTNPPIDPIREELVMSLDVTLGAKAKYFFNTLRQTKILDLSYNNQFWTTMR